MADEHLDCGSPIAYLVLRSGTAVYTSGKEQIGTVDRILFVQEEDVFDGIVIQTSGGLRFVDSDQVDRIYERCVMTTLSLEDARSLPPPTDGPPVYAADPAEWQDKSLTARFRRLFGKARWSKRQRRQSSAVAPLTYATSVTIALSFRDLVMGGTFRSTARASAPSVHHLSGEPVLGTGSIQPSAPTLIPCRESTR
jgi:hypothetical protein